MIAIKLPIKNQINIDDYLREFNSCIRFSYNRFVEGLLEKDIRQLIKLKNLYSTLDSWFIQCAIRESQSWFKKVPNGKLIFGGKRNFELRSQNKISKEQLKELRLHPICIQGEAPQKGNRKFDLDIENNKIIFKPKRGDKIEIQLPNLRNNHKRNLLLLEEYSNKNEIPFTIRLSNKEICIIFDEKILKENIKPLNSNRVLGIDLNPNYIGWSVLEFNKDDNFKVIKTGVIENIELNKKLKVSSNDLLQINQNNKKTFEIFEVSKFLISKTLHFNCSKIIVEELQILIKNHKKGKSFNRLVNNCWNRNKLINNLNKRCNISGIEFVEVNPVYSSFIGNVLYGKQYPDMVASSIEISRRGFHKWQKNWFYPKLIEVNDLSNLWKEEKDLIYKNWTELFNVITKTLKLNYRSSLNDFKFRVFRLNNIKSKINLYCFN
jgi:IS605 OrfB family transposase